MTRARLNLMCLDFGCLMLEYPDQIIIMDVENAKRSIAINPKLLEMVSEKVMLEKIIEMQELKK